jgi:transposase
MWDPRGSERAPAPMRTHSSATSTKADGFRRLEIITGVGRRRRWSDEDKARIVAESLDPRTTAAAVARRYGLHASQLFVWRQQLQRRASAAEPIGGPGFVPVLLAEDDAAPAEAVGRMEIALGPAVVRVGVDVDAAALRRVLEVVRGLA